MLCFIYTNRDIMETENAALYYMRKEVFLKTATQPLLNRTYDCKQTCYIHFTTATQVLELSDIYNIMK
jgi:hypothetical protein